jgi:hypothetical protein
MVEAGTIRKEDLSACLCCLVADHLSVATAIPSADREEKVSWTDRCSHLLRLVSAVQR